MFRRKYPAAVGKTAVTKSIALIRFVICAAVLVSVCFLHNPSSFADDAAALEKLRGLGASVRTINVGQAPYVEIVIAADNWKGRDDDLAALAQVTQPITLDLSRAALTTAGVGRLKGVSRLTKLHLAGATLSDDVLKQIGAIGSLKVLELDNATFDNASLAHLAGLKHLQSIMLSQSSINDAGLDHLATIKSLQLVMLLRSQVSDAAVIRLRQALPDASVVK